MGILIAVVVVAGVLGWIIVKNDELSGLGRNVRPGSFRSPHGKLVHVKPLGELPAEERWSKRFLRCFPLVSSVAVTALACLVLVLQNLSVASPAVEVLIDALNTPIPAVVIAGECLLRGKDGIRLLPTFIVALLGALLMQVIVSVPLGCAGWAVESAGIVGAFDAVMAIGLLLLSPWAYALGAALVLARTGRMVKFRRRFADGSENDIEVSTNSVAYGAYREMMDAKAA